MSSNEWKSYKLGEIATFYNGRAYKNEEFKNFGTPIVRIQNLTGEGKTVYSDLDLDANKYIEAGDLIYAWSATFGPYIWKGSRSIYHYHIWKIECNNRLLDKQYLYYKLRVISDSLQDRGNGTLFVHITKSFIESFEISIPLIETQRRVASILSALDDKIELNSQTNATLEALAQSIFNEWFVEFNFSDATREMVESELGMIPKEWKVGKLGEILSFKNGKSSPERKSNYPYPVYGANGIIGFAEIYNSTEKNVIIGRVGSFCGAVYYATEKSFVTENAIIAESMKNVSSTFCFNLLRALNLNNFKVGSGQPLINQSILSGIDIVIPSVEVMRTYEEIIFPLYSKIYENDKQSATLAALRDTLLPRLMNGAIELE